MKNNPHIPTQPDFWWSDNPLIGLKVPLEREIDLHQLCHDNVAEICTGRVDAAADDL